MKKGQNIIAAVSMFFVIIACLLTSFQVAVYGDPEYEFYREEYEKYHVTDVLDMTMDDVMEVTDYMMAYLIGDEDELSIVTDVDGRQQDFFNEQDRLHMADVRNLFLGGIKLRTMLLVAAALLIALLICGKADWKHVIPRAYSWALRVFLIMIMFLGIAFSVDFTRCFVIFHKMFFSNDLWLFDPATDYMIRMLPEGFFSDMVLRVVMTFLVMLFLLWILMRIWKSLVKTKVN